MQPSTTAAERGEVQRKLGRCILRLQQYEMLCKAILADHSQSGTMRTWEARRAARVARFSRMTLGQLVGEMKSSWLANADAPEPSPSSEEPDFPQEIWFRTQLQMTQQPAEFANTIAAMEALVSMRNELVHHFLQRFDLWDAGTCARADQYLDDSYDVIEGHMQELHTWARHMVQASESYARFAASEEFQTLVFSYGATEGGELERTPAQTLSTLPDYAPICQLLRAAERVHAQVGWTPLEHAIAYVNKVSGHTEFPSRYRCRKWHQLLRRSGIFDIEERPLPERPGLFLFYRTKSPPTI